MLKTLSRKVTKYSAANEDKENIADVSIKRISTYITTMEEAVKK